MDIDKELVRYDPAVLKRIGEDDGYWEETIEELEESSGQHLFLSCPKTPLALARHIILSHFPDDGNHSCDGTCRDSFVLLAFDLVWRCERLEKKTGSHGS